MKSIEPRCRKDGWRFALLRVAASPAGRGTAVLEPGKLRPAAAAHDPAAQLDQTVRWRSPSPPGSSWPAAVPLEDRTDLALISERERGGYPPGLDDAPPVPKQLGLRVGAPLLAVGARRIVDGAVRYGLVSRQPSEGLGRMRDGVSTAVSC
jgi:hypothetical protein